MMKAAHGEQVCHRGARKVGAGGEDQAATIRGRAEVQALRRAMGSPTLPSSTPLGAAGPLRSCGAPPILEQQPLLLGLPLKRHPPKSPRSQAQLLSQLPPLLLPQLLQLPARQVREYLLSFHTEHQKPGRGLGRPSTRMANHTRASVKKVFSQQPAAGCLNGTDLCLRGKATLKTGLVTTRLIMSCTA